MRSGPGETRLNKITYHSPGGVTALDRRPNHPFFRGLTPSSMFTNGAGNAWGSSTSPSSDCFTGGNEGSFHVTDLSELAVPGRDAVPGRELPGRALRKGDRSALPSSLNPADSGLPGMSSKVRISAG